MHDRARRPAAPLERTLAGLAFAALGLAAPAPTATTTAGAVSEAVPFVGRCALEITLRDASGGTVLQTVAYALGRPGLVVASLGSVEAAGERWTHLLVAPDPLLNAAPPAAATTATILETDPARDHLLLRATGVEACGEAAVRPVEGAVLLGLRERDGYRPRIFHARLVRRVAAGVGPELMLITIDDGAGASAGIVLDLRGRLAGTIVPPPAGSDPGLLVALSVDEAWVAAAAGRASEDRAASGRDAPPGPGFAGTAPGLLARALLLTRDDQSGGALALLDEAALMGGESPGLLMERGTRRFKSGRLEGAIDDLARLVRMDPGSRLAHYNLGIALGVAGRNREAAQAFARAAAIEPDHARTRYQLALALQAADRTEEARQEWERLSRLDAGLAVELRSLLGF